MIDPQLADWLRAEGFDGLLSRGDNKATPLMRAAQKGDVEMAKKLLAAGGDVSGLNADGNNAIWLACFGQSVEVLDLLLDAGLSIDHVNDNGATALMFAASSGRTAVVEDLLKRGADISAETADGFSALDMANTIEILTLLRAARKQQKAKSA
jgi:thiosulfate/3-mercaptopyruvate sulfurtransferase